MSDKKVYIVESPQFDLIIEKLDEIIEKQNSNNTEEAVDENV